MTPEKEAIKLCKELKWGLMLNCKESSIKSIAIKMCCEYQKHDYLGSFNYWEEVKKEIKNIELIKILKTKQIELIKQKIATTLSNLNELLDYRDALLRTENRNTEQQQTLDLLEKFTEDLPLSLDKNIDTGFKLIREFVAKIGENNRIKEVQKECDHHHLKWQKVCVDCKKIITEED